MGAVVLTLGGVDIEDGVLGKEQVEVWKRRGERRRETGEGQNEEATNGRSNTHHGWHEDGMKRAHRHIGWLVLSHAV